MQNVGRAFEWLEVQQEGVGSKVPVFRLDKVGVTNTCLGCSLGRIHRFQSTPSIVNTSRALLGPSGKTFRVRERYRPGFSTF